MPEQPRQTFCSYCREDSAFALRLAGDLKAAGAHVWLDQLDIVPGERWDRAVEEALAVCPRMLVILSSVSVNSTNVMDEVSAALDGNKIVIPVILGDCKIPFRLRRLQHVDFRLDYSIALSQLLKAFGTTHQEDARGRQTTVPPERLDESGADHGSGEAATARPPHPAEGSIHSPGSDVRRSAAGRLMEQPYRPEIDRQGTSDHAARERTKTSLLDDVEHIPSIKRLRGAITGLLIAAPLIMFVAALGWFSLDPLEKTVRYISFFSLPLLGLIVGAAVRDVGTSLRGGVAGATIGGLNTLLAWPLGWWFWRDTNLGTAAMDVYKSVMLYLPGATLGSGLVGIAAVAVVKVLSARFESERAT